MDEQTIKQITNARLNASQAAALKALTTQQEITDYPYYSSVCFRALASVDEVEASPIGWSYRFLAGQIRRAFSFGRGDSGVQAGFTDAIDGLMTIAETNLVKKSETIGGHQVQIDGLAIYCKPAMTDGERFLQSRLLAQISTNVSVQMSINGDRNLFPLGTIHHMPGAGGVVGPGNDDLSFIPAVYDKAPLAGNIGGPFSFAQNGWQTRGNYYRFPNGIIWNPAGKHDSMLNVVFTNERDFRIMTGGTPEREQLFQLAGEVPVPFKPAHCGVVLGVQLIGQVVGPRTRAA